MGVMGNRWRAGVGALRSPGLVVTGLFFAALFVVPPVYGQYLPQRISDYLIFGLPALAVALIAGHARLLNVGVGATFGVSAYTVAILSQHGVLNPVLLMLASLAAGVLVSVLFAIYAVVATGLEYLLLTLLTTSAFFTLPLLFTKLTGGENGLGVKGAVGISFGLDPLQGNGFYWFLCAITAFWCLLSWYLLSCRAGRAMIAIGRNPIRAAAMGYSVYAYQVVVTLYSGLIAASAGWLYALAHAFVFEDLLGLNDSVNFVLYSLVGGVDTILGPLLGTAGLRYLGEYLGQQSTQSQLYVGVALLIVVYLLPAGVIGALRQLWQLRRRIRSGAAAPSDALGAVLTQDTEIDQLFRGATEE
ncbi:MAG TPA: branched-chain amino acid ABC transporter permease [Candidatus Dormibacteraeota bacterium]|jgi:branched-chain amino acid transport system permease protein|nr:branched-chain amino acid ABC transporter permease [Candidatus Dormibacteraeota bacterium]